MDNPLATFQPPHHVSDPDPDTEATMAESPAPAKKQDAEKSSRPKLRSMRVTDTAGAQTKFLSARAPAGVAFLVDISVLELGLSGFKAEKGELLAALVHEYCGSEQDKLESLRRVIENYRTDYSA